MRIEIGRSVARPEALGLLLEAVQTDGRRAGLPVLELVIGYPRRDGPSHAGAAVADVGAHRPPFGRQPKPRTEILSVIDSSPVRGLVRTHPRPQPALRPRADLSPRGADLTSAPGSVSAISANNRFRMMNLSSHNIPKALTFAYTTRTAGARGCGSCSLANPLVHDAVTRRIRCW